ncbi:MAG: dihydroorotate dehydrogenase-like protein [Planctomycetota bacterium]
MTVDLSTKYLGLGLKNPLVVSACPLSEKVDSLKRLEEAGASAVVLYSLFEEQIEHEELELVGARERGAEAYAEHSNWFPELDDYRLGPRGYVEHIEKAKNALSIPVIASLNGTSEGGWTDYAQQMQNAGADALELNIYFIAADPDMPGADVEKRYLDLVAAVKQSISIPLAVKVGSQFSSPGNMAKRLAEAGADGLVLFNRFLQPDIELDQLDVRPRVKLSTPYELLLPLRWIAILHGRVEASLALTSGIHSAEALAKSLVVGADVGMVASTIYKNGFDQVGTIVDGLTQWMKKNDYDSLNQFKGVLSQANCPDPAAFERGNYMKALTSYTGQPA